MNNAEEQRKTETTDRIRSYVYRYCSTMTAQDIATELGISIRVVHLYYPNPAR
jgi:hypothetical protein